MLKIDKIKQYKENIKRKGTWVRKNRILKDQMELEDGDVLGVLFILRKRCG